MAIDIFRLKYYSIAFVIAPFCFFFPYHAAFGSLAFFGVWHIFAEVHVWNGIEPFEKDSRQYFKWVTLSALGLSLLSLIPLLLDAVGEPPLRYFSNFFLTVFGIWFLCFGLLHIIASRSNLKVFLISSVLVLFIVLAWVVPSLDYFFLVHVHNILPWLVIYHLTNKKRIFLPAVTICLIIPTFIFLLILSNQGHVSSLSLSTELEQEIFRQVVHSKFGLVSGTTLLGYFAYQQIMHYFLWIFLIPNLLGKGFQMRIPSNLNLNSKEKFFLPILILFTIVMFFLFPVNFRRLYFAFGFFHIAIEFPLLIACFVSAKVRQIVN